MQKKKCTAIVLAAGQGKRMGTKVQKQYLEIDGKPVLYYSLHAFEQSKIIDEIILVVGENQSEYCKDEIVSKYGISKVNKIVEGGAERYHSVWNGLQEVDDGGYVFIHDGARPFVDEEILKRAYKDVQNCKACVIGMPVKDTIKVVDSLQYAVSTPDRSTLWAMQTPQCFTASLLRESYEKILMMQKNGMEIPSITDDAMVVEFASGRPVKLLQGDYRNIKITTPEDMLVAKVFLEE